MVPDLTSLTADEKEIASGVFKIIQEDQSKIIEQNRDKPLLSEPRYVHFQPVMDLKIKEHYRYHRMVNVLNLLQEKGTIIKWKDEYEDYLYLNKDLKLVPFKIVY